MPDRAQRGFAFTAAGTAARLNNALTPELYEALRTEGRRGFAEHAIDDTLDYVPFRDLPPRFKWWSVLSTGSNKVLRVLLWPQDTFWGLRETLRRRRS